MLQGTNTNVWIGLKQTEVTGEPTEGWNWIVDEGKTTPEPYDEQKWINGNPKKNDTYDHCGAILEL